MAATSLVGMPVSNAATSVVMLPIALSVIRLTERPGRVSSHDARNLELCMMFGVAYGTSIAVGLVTALAFTVLGPVLGFPALPGS